MNEVDILQTQLQKLSDEFNDYKLSTEQQLTEMKEIIEELIINANMYLDDRDRAKTFYHKVQKHPMFSMLGFKL